MRGKVRRSIAGWVGALVFLLAAGWPLGAPAARPRPLRVGATTTTKTSGILDALHDAFQKKTGLKIHSIAVGTGQALRAGRSGDVDVVFVHSPAAERRFVAEGFGVRRRLVMESAFVIVGPAGDPAGIGGERDAPRALRRIAESRSPFFSRGDDSGTHRKEAALWRLAGARPAGPWYFSVGQGMAQTLRVADEKFGYALSDRASFLALSAKGLVDLRVLSEGDERLYNPYSVIVVNPARNPHVRFSSARKYSDFLVSPEGQRLIGAFMRGGRRLYNPAAKSSGRN